MVVEWSLGIMAGQQARGQTLPTIRRKLQGVEHGRVEQDLHIPIQDVRSPASEPFPRSSRLPNLACRGMFAAMDVMREFARLLVKIVGVQSSAGDVDLCGVDLATPKAK